ncbi:MAG TPA: ThuA domain-containing protein [Chloroflexota bacterium]|jgi:type 1 glutamine amidotransferase|nr:ThuA domain-containing protein [Chloroflexota bacterium]
MTAPQDPTAPQAPRALLLLGQPARIERQFHNQPEHWALLAGHLRAADLSARHITDDLDVLNPHDLPRFDVILNYTSETDVTEAQVEALLAAVEGGAGYVGLHGATATFTRHPSYLAMIGARFRRHDPIKPFTIRFVDRDHPITQGLEDYEHEDELYELTADFEDRQNVKPLFGIRVLAEAEGHPMVYVKEYGAGRVAYLASGHDARSLGQQTYRTLFTRAVAWAARRAVP